MSYSRWGEPPNGSRWYSYYSTEHEFVVDGGYGPLYLTYQELKDDIRACLRRVVMACGEDPAQCKIPQPELRELELYMRYYMEDYETKVHRLETHSFDEDTNPKLKAIEAAQSLFDSLNLTGVYEYSKRVRIDLGRKVCVISWRDEKGSHELTKPFKE